MKPFAAFVVLVLALVPGALAQDIVPDTLDWHGYYPLEVGNAWEWTVLSADVDFARTEIVADTLVDGTRYFVVWSVDFSRDSGVHPGSDRKTLIRYDNDHFDVVWLRNDGLEVPSTCDLGADFGSDVSCVPFDGMIYDGVTSRGGYKGEGECLSIGSQCAPYAAQKTYLYPQWGGMSFTYAHGIGRTSSETVLSTSELTYARVGGVEYGESAVFVGNEETPDGAVLDVAVYPNPARNRAWLTLPVPARHLEVTMYDLLGRTVQAGQACTSSPCELELDALSPGLYFVRVAEGSRMAGVVPVLVER